MKRQITAYIPKKHLHNLAAGLLAAGLTLALAGCGIRVTQTPSGTSTEQPAASEGSVDVANASAASPASMNSSDDGTAPGKPRPQDDYYGYVNKEYLDSLEVSYADPAGVGGMAEITDTVDGELCRMITGIAASSEFFEPGSNEQLVRDTYNQLLEYLTTGSGGGKQHFTETASGIRAAKNLTDLKELIRLLVREEGITAYIDATVEENYYDGKSYALTILQKRSFAGFDMKDIYRDDDTRQNLHSFACNVLIAAGEDIESARRKAKELVYFVTDISCHTDFSNDKAANPYLALDFSTNAETDALLSNLTSGELSRIYDLENPYGGWVIEDEGQLAYMSEAFCEENLDILKSWLLCEVMYAWQYYLKNDFIFLESFTAADTRGTAAALAVKATCELLDTQVSELYAACYYTEEMDRQLRRMYDDIKTSYRELIQKADWLTEDTRSRLLRKLENMTFVCGGGRLHTPDPKDADLIGADIFETARRIAVRRRADLRAKIGAEIDREALGISSYIANARYRLSNSFTICVGIMHAPYFDADNGYADNLGGLGIVMAHEIGHAFDSMCIDYDEYGAYNPDGICGEDRGKLAQRLKQMEDYYSSFAVMDIYYVDGKRTSSENYADKGAMECLMNIVKTPADREKVFEGYARAFHMLMEDNYAISLLDEDEHSPNEVRVNAVLASTEEFYDLYQVQPTDAMYIPPEKRVSRYK